MADMICAVCGEPWDIYHVLHDEKPKYRKMLQTGKGCACCNGKAPKGMTKKQKDLLSFEAMVSECDASDEDSFLIMERHGFI